ncbi:MAG: MFS transporter [Xenococcaceae cyanobacterium MO_234.B1]|nr:MFS transporter [Xenococcaceae cyanobacterium MO_234.B1]
MDLTQREKLSGKTQISYGVGELAGAIPGNIQVFFLLFFLTNIAGLNPTQAGMILLLGKAWDALNDPLIGWLSDRTRSTLGRRYPWMIYGGVPLGLGFCLQWLVLPTTNQWVMFAYYTTMALLFYTAFTAVLLPFNALAAELTSGYNERTSLISFKSGFSIGGSIFSLIVAQVIFKLVSSPSKQYFCLGLIGGGLATLAVYVSIWGTYRHYQLVQTQKSQIERPPPAKMGQQLKIALSNRPFLYLMGIYLGSWLGVQVTAAILPYFVINWMKLPEYHFTQMALAVQGTALSMMFIWTALSRRVGKKAIYSMGIPMTIVASVGLFMLQPGQIGWMYFWAVMAGIGIATAYLVPWSMLPDVVDLDELKTGQRREGIYYGCMVQLQKFSVAMALFLVGKILDWAGFISTVGGQTPPIQPDSALWAIRLIIGPVTILSLVVGLILSYFYPISRAVHGEIVLKLNQRQNSGSE